MGKKKKEIKITVDLSSDKDFDLIEHFLRSRQQYLFMYKGKSKGAYRLIDKRDHKGEKWLRCPQQR
jgi:hypothetical protein